MNMRVDYHLGARKTVSAPGCNFSSEALADVGFNARRLGRLFLLLALQAIGKARFNEACEKGMSLGWFRLKFGMKLYPDKPWMIFDFYDFNQLAFRIHAGDSKTFFLEGFAE